jgi:hypothetical protein
LVSIKAVYDLPFGIPKVRSLSLDFAASKIRKKKEKKKKKRLRE